MEEYFNKTSSQIREALRVSARENLTVQKMQNKIVGEVKITPAEVRRFYSSLSQDSIPYIPTMVEVEIITRKPKIPQEEIEDVKRRLREYTDRVNKGETSFQTLARLYSEDPGSRRNGGELDYTGRGMLDPAFAAVAFNLTDPKKVSKIVESEFGFHIIQLVDKRGEKIKVRHILRKPIVSDSAIVQATNRLDSIAKDIRAGLFTFEEGASVISDDKDTRNNKGLMANRSERGQTSKFQLQDLPSEVAKVVDTLKVGQISEPFVMINNNGKTVCAIAKLKSRTEGHKAIITEDFQVMKDVVTEKRREKKLHDWVVKKIKDTYVHVGDRYRDCQFEYQGWIK
jgi:peptidyl-prolyl cis-trans isomerase SurA